MTSATFASTPVCGSGGSAVERDQVDDLTTPSGQGRHKISWQGLGRRRGR